MKWARPRTKRPAAFLLIDTTAANTVRVACRQQLLQRSINREQQTSNVLCALIASCLKRAGVDWSDLSGIGVRSGPGPFTSLRVGVATANTLGFLLSLPVVGVHDGREQSFAAFTTAAVKRLSGKKSFSPVRPFYGRPPHITATKKQKAFF